MDIAIAHNSGSEDYRVPLTPGAVGSITKAGNNVYLLQGAGTASGYSDREYELKGANIVYSSEEIYKRGDLLVSVSSPSMEALSFINNKTVVMSFLHLAVASEKYLELLIEKEITSIGFEVISDENCELPLEVSTGEIAGALSVQIAANYLQSNMGGKGILLGGAPGIEPAKVLIIGAGSVGRTAAKIAAAIGAEVLIVDRNVRKLRQIEDTIGMGISTGFSSIHGLSDWIKDADVVIGAVYLKGAKSPVVVTEEMVSSMKKGSIIIDLSIDQGGCVETSRRTTLSSPIFEYKGIIHYCVPNIPSLAAKASSQALSHALYQYIIQMSQHGSDFLKNIPDIARGTYTHKGKITMKVLAELFRKEYFPIEGLL